VFRLAAEVAEEQERSPAALSARAQVEAKLRRSRVASHRPVARPVAASIAVAVPVVASLAAATLLTAPLWNDGPAGIERATAVALGAMTSLPVAAGFVLAMAAGAGGLPRRRAIVRIALAGVVAAVVAGLGLWALLSAKALVAPDQVGIACQYFAMLSALWLASGLVLTGGGAWWATGALAAGTVVGVVLRVAGHVPMVAAQRAGILSAAAIALLAFWTRSARAAGAARRSPADRRRLAVVSVDVKPSARSRVRTITPLALLGASFAGLLLLPLVASWYSQSPPHPWVLALRPDTQAGWTWALVAVAGAVAVVAASARGFAGLLGGIAERTPLTAPGQMAWEVRAGRRRAGRRVVLASVVGAAVSSVVLLVPMAASTSFADALGGKAASVFAVALPGLVLASLAGLDSAMLLTVRRPAAAVVAAWVGFAVAAVVAVVLATTSPGWTAAAALDAGALVCWVLVALGARRILRTPDVALATRG